MPKIATKYYQINPWKIVEEGFKPERAVNSESIFSLANEYMGVRGFFDEDYSGDQLIGTYFNGVYEIPFEKQNEGYKGISKDIHYMVNSVNFFKTHIKINGNIVDLNKCHFHSFFRELNLKSGLLTRVYVYVDNDLEVEIKFSRILDMVSYPNCYQLIELKALKNSAVIELTSSLDYGIKHWGKFKYFDVKEVFYHDSLTVLSETKQTNQRILSNVLFIPSASVAEQYDHDQEKIGKKFIFNLNENESFSLEKRITNIVDRNHDLSLDDLIKKCDYWVNFRLSFSDVVVKNTAYFEKLWNECDIEIIGDDENQQGIRYCIFQLLQTYQGVSPKNNIGAKGLTGEAYSGHAFWDTETYCLPFYLFNNQKAAKNLLMFRYNTLNEAKERAKALDCIGACYPIATLNGKEGCNLWQHASLQFQPTTAVSYAIWHYLKLTDDVEFLYKYGLEMLVETSRFLASRGDWNHDLTHFGFYGVMGPDEFQMMVNHNTYTNYMAKRTFEYTVECLNRLKIDSYENYLEFMSRHRIDQSEIEDLKLKAEKMYIIYDEKTHLFEQHQGYYDLPHLDINQIPVEDFPLYAHWSYDRIYRNDMIKQPDVLMMMLLYNQSFTYQQKLSNYEFYEQRTIHESSLSPSVHSILASELGKSEEALKFFKFATRMDLDDYNRNTHEGLHMTSIAAAWMNIVYGFGGLRSDGDILQLAPTIPSNWDSYQFSFVYKKSRIKVFVTQHQVTLKVSGDEIVIKIYDEIVQVREFLVIGIKK